MRIGSAHPTPPISAMRYNGFREAHFNLQTNILSFICALTSHHLETFFFKHSPSEDRRKHHILRTEVTAFLGELIGTFMFLSLAFTGTQIALNAAGTNDLTASSNPIPDVGKLLYIAFAFGVSLAINVAIFADISGGKFNPAVSPAVQLVLIYPSTRATPFATSLRRGGCTNMQCNMY